jgi:hypothetical protein
VPPSHGRVGWDEVRPGWIFDVRAEGGHLVKEYDYSQHATAITAGERGGGGGLGASIAFTYRS